ncbi:hypothetical protein MMA231_04168 (plasmid) [Asticcacaulis sp. MM231]|uniref:TrbI/VirB10 family protein n=1 Tax=Asticcacaulis sp. MM231 TaxID=3157666 RepID=UPI0032D5830C
MTDETAVPEIHTPDLRLRTEPKTVLRLSRKVLIGGSLVFAMTGGGILMFAMQPQPATPKPVEVQPGAQRPQVSEKLSGLPSDYTAYPVLGPPLPGDLGRPILSAQAAEFGGSVPLDAGLNPTATYQNNASASPAVSAVEQARQTAITSQVFFGGPSRGAMALADGASAVPVSMTEILDGLGVPGLTAASEPPMPTKDTDLNHASDLTTVSHERLQRPASPYLLQAGSVIPAALITGLHSDIPGQALAQVTQNIFDTRTGTYLLIPQGARLIGKYDSAVAFGQDRLLLVWERIILPNGASLVLDKAGTADPQGLNGLQDRTNLHWGGVMQASAASTVLSIGAASGSASRDSDLVRALRSGAADSVSRVGQALVERQLNVSPSITLRNGLPLRVVLARDLVLEPYKE